MDGSFSIWSPFTSRSLSGCDLSDDNLVKSTSSEQAGSLLGKWRAAGSEAERGKNSVSIISQMSQAVFQRQEDSALLLRTALTHTHTHTHTLCVAHILQIILTKVEAFNICCCSAAISKTSSQICTTRFTDAALTSQQMCVLNQKFMHIFLMYLLVSDGRFRLTLVQTETSQQVLDPADWSDANSCSPEDVF